MAWQIPVAIAAGGLKFLGGFLKRRSAKKHAKLMRVSKGARAARAAVGEEEEERGATAKRAWNSDAFTKEAAWALPGAPKRAKCSQARAAAHNDWLEEGVLQAAFTRSKPKALAQARPVSTGQVLHTRSVASAVLLEQQNKGLRHRLEQLENHIVEVRQRQAGYRLPCIAVETMPDGTNIECALPPAVPFVLKGLQVLGTGGGNQQVPVEVVLREVSWPSDRRHGIGGFVAPVVVPPIAIGRSTAQTLFAARGRSEVLAPPGAKPQRRGSWAQCFYPDAYPIRPELFQVIWILFDADAAKENLRCQSFYIRAWKKVGHPGADI